MPFDDDLIEVVTPERVELNFPIAGLGSRFAAAFIDLIIIILLNTLITFLGILIFATIQLDNDYIFSIAFGAAIRNLMRIVDIVLFSFAIGFLILFLSKLSQRPGDFAAGTIVVRDRSITLADLDHYLKSTSDKPSNSNAKLDARFQKLNDEDARVIEMFMSRRHQLQLSQRREMAEQIANGIREKLGIKKDEYGSDEILIRTANNALKSRRDKW
jgi:uncharacterized RDD family membrane protein YckC